MKRSTTVLGLVVTTFSALLILATLLASQNSFASTRVCEDFQSCAEASLDKMGYITSDCTRVQNDAQDRCSAHSINKIGYVTGDCLKLDSGGRCAVASIEKMGYVTSDCTRVANDRQDRCASASIKKIGYVTSDCLRL